MAINTFLLDKQVIGASRIFPDLIENDETIGFHGTSSYYSSDIETNGFYLHKVLPEHDLDLIMSIGKRAGLNVNNISGFRSLQTISFSPSSEVALFYTRPEALGGQGLGFVKGVVNNLLEDSSGLIQPLEMSRIRDIKSTIDSICSSSPVIYAVDLNGLPASRYDILTQAIHVQGNVLPDRIRAKIVVPAGLNYSLIDLGAQKVKLRKILYSAKPHFIKTIR